MSRSVGIFGGGYLDGLAGSSRAGLKGCAAFEAFGDSGEETEHGGQGRAGQGRGEVRRYGKGSWESCVGWVCVIEGYCCLYEYLM